MSYELSCWLIEKSVITREGTSTEYYNSREKKWDEDPFEATGFNTIEQGDATSKKHKLGSCCVVKHIFNGENFK